MISKALIVLACAAVALGGVRKLSGPQVFKAGGKIVGGSPAAAGEIPWQVSLQYYSSKLHFCSGSIISEYWIVTSASCSYHNSPSGIHVIAGTLEHLNGGTTHRVRTIITHEGYDGWLMEYNIAVWEIADPFTFDANTAAVALLPQGTPSITGTATVVSGWGTTSAGNGISDVLLKAVVPIFDFAACNDAYSDYGGIEPNQICAGVEEGGVGPCSGDAGDPLYFNGTLHGMFSWGHDCSSAGYPGIYIHVASFRDWITYNTGV